MQKPPSCKVDLDVLILGGGVAGLWTLDALVQAGHNAALVEATALGDGQSICAQGILHGGVKYSLPGLLDSSSKAIASLPERWDRNLAGKESPDLRSALVRSESCHLWRTDSLKSIAGMIGAKIALQVRPIQLAREERPEALRDCPGDVVLLPEKVLETPSLLGALAALHPGRIIKGIVCQAESDDRDNAWMDIALADETSVLVTARNLVLAAGAGTPKLLETMNESASMFAMQRRPLHMAMVKGPEDVLPELNGHCVDGGKTKVTITSTTSQDGQRVWQLGGELAEEGCSRTTEEQCAAAKACLGSVLPGFDPNNPFLAWASYKIDRAENKTLNLKRPRDAFACLHKRIVVTWPTKMVLAPRAADRVVELLGHRRGAGDPPFPDAPVPQVALPPWEVAKWN